MQILVDIPEEVYNRCSDDSNIMVVGDRGNGKTMCGMLMFEFFRAIKKGIPLPNGHGFIEYVIQIAK